MSPMANSFVNGVLYYYIGCDLLTKKNIKSITLKITILNKGCLLDLLYRKKLTTNRTHQHKTSRLIVCCVV